MQLKTLLSILLIATPSFGAWDIVATAGTSVNDSLNLGTNRVRVQNGGFAGGLNLGVGLMNIGSAKLEAELPFLASTTDRIEIGFGGLDVSGWTLFFTPGARLRIGTDRVSAFASFGAGVAREESISLASIVNIGGSSHFSLGYGGGADLRLLGPLKIRGEIRNFAVKGPVGWSNRPFVMGGIGLQF